MNWIESVFLLIFFGAGAWLFGFVQKHVKFCESQHELHGEWCAHINSELSQQRQIILRLSDLAAQAAPAATGSPDRNVEAIRQRLLDAAVYIEALLSRIDREEAKEQP